MDDFKVCQVCEASFQAGDMVTRVEVVYRIGRIGVPEVTNHGTYIHVNCAGRKPA